MNYKYQCVSLKCQASMVIARCLWYNWEGWNDLGNRIPHENEEELWVDEVSENRYLLPLPPTMYSELYYFIEITFNEIYRWFWNLQQKLGNNVLTLKSWHKLVWTSTGTIDRTQTVPLIVRDYSINIDLYDRFVLACLYFLETDVRTLEKELYDKGWCKKDLLDNMKGDRMYFQVLKFWLDREEEFFFDLTTVLMYFGVDAFQYLSQLRAPETRQDDLRKAIDRTVRLHSEYQRDHEVTFGTTSISNKLYILLPLLDDEQKKRLFKESAHHILSCFLIYPRLQNNFLEMFQEVSEFMSPSGYCFVYQRIYEKIISGESEFDYLLLFEKLCEQSGKIFKKLWISMNSSLYSSHLYKALQTGDRKIFELLLTVSELDGRSLILSTHGRAVCEMLIRRAQINHLSTFLELCVFDEYSAMHIKGVIKEIMEALDEEYNEMMNGILQFLDDFKTKGSCAPTDLE